MGWSPKTRIREQYIYVLQCSDFFKVGVAKYPRERAIGHQVSCPLVLKVVFISPARFKPAKARLGETIIIYKYRKWYRRGEWLRIPDPDMRREFLESLPSIVASLDTDPDRLCATLDPIEWEVPADG